MAHASYGNHSPADGETGQPAGKSEDRPGFDLGGAKEKGSETGLPAAGPHGKPDLVNEDATPGTGALPDVGDEDATDSTSS
jgi:hypothetical protein